MCRVRLDGDDLGCLPADWTLVTVFKDGRYEIRAVVDSDGKVLQLEPALALAAILSSTSRPEVRGRR